MGARCRHRWNFAGGSLDDDAGVPVAERYDIMWCSTCGVWIETQQGPAGVAIEVTRVEPGVGPRPLRRVPADVRVLIAAILAEKGVAVRRSLWVAWDPMIGPRLPFAITGAEAAVWCAASGRPDAAAAMDRPVEARAILVAMCAAAAAELDAAARAGRGVPAWVAAITAPAGWRRYDRLREG